MNNFKTQGHHCAYKLFTPLPATQHRDTHVSVLEWHTRQCSGEICYLHSPSFLLWRWRMWVSPKKLTSPQPRKLSFDYVNTQATRTEYVTSLLLWDAKYFSITVHVWCKHASPIGLTVRFTEPSDPRVLQIKGLEGEGEADWLPPTIPLCPHIFMAWYFNQHRDNFKVT